MDICCLLCSSNPYRFKVRAVKLTISNFSLSDSSHLLYLKYFLFLIFPNFEARLKIYGNLISGNAELRSDVM